MRGTSYLGLKLSWFEMLEEGGLEKKHPPDPEDCTEQEEMAFTHH